MKNLMTYEEFKNQMDSYLDQIIEKSKEKDEKGINEIYDKIERFEKMNTHFAAMYNEKLFSH